MPRKSKKRQNGQGNSITLKFNTDDPQEAAALAMSKRLAGTRKGKRKDLIVAVLAAAEHVYQQTGQLPNAYEISALLMGYSAQLQPRGTVGFSNLIGQPTPTQPSQNFNLPPGDMTAEQRRASLHHAGNSPSVAVTEGGKASAAEVGANFVRGMTAAFFD